MADFKDELSPELVGRLADAFSDVSGSFDSADFQQRAVSGLDGLELKARVTWIARALAEVLPASPDDAARLIQHAVDNDNQDGKGNLQGWASMAVNEYIATAMLDRPDIALPLLGTLTSHYTAEFANHLNDISKDHPGLVLDTARRWAGESTQGDFVVRHGLRTLIKRGDPGALAILGFDHDAPIELTELSCSPSAITIGETTTISFTLHASAPTKAAIDYLVHYQGAHGAKAGKVFKLTVRDLPAGEPVSFSRRHAFKHVSIRTIRPGPHRIEIQANGRILGATTVDVVAER